MGKIPKCRQKPGHPGELQQLNEQGQWEDVDFSSDSSSSKRKHLGSSARMSIVESSSIPGLTVVRDPDWDARRADEYNRRARIYRAALHRGASVEEACREAEGRGSITTITPDTARLQEAAQALGLSKAESEHFAQNPNSRGYEEIAKQIQ